MSGGQDKEQLSSILDLSLDKEWRLQVGQTGRSANTHVVGEERLGGKPRSQQCVSGDPQQ